jgi:DNA-binding transcriptional regulator YiaG
MARTWSRPRQKIQTEALPRFDVAYIRYKMRYLQTDYSVTQDNFARAIGVSAGTVRNWEQGRRQPTGPARVLLALIERDPAIIRATLGGAS